MTAASKPELLAPKVVEDAAILQKSAERVTWLFGGLGMVMRCVLDTSQLLVKAQEEVVVKATKDQSGNTTVAFGTNNSGFQAGIVHGGVNGITFGKK